MKEAKASKMDKFGMDLRSAIEFPATSLYTFNMISDESIKLYIDGKPFIETTACAAH